MTLAHAGMPAEIVDGALEARSRPTTDAAPGDLVDAADRMARRFARGGRLLVAGSPTTSFDVDHVIVEFVHPVIAGSRSIPGLRCPHPDDPSSTGWWQWYASGADVVLVLGRSTDDPLVRTTVVQASAVGALPVAIVDVVTDRVLRAHVIETGARDHDLAKESRVVAYHVLWELVQLQLARLDTPRSDGAP